MHEDVFRGRRRVVLTSMVAAGAVIALAACSSSGGTSGGSGGAATGGASAGNLPASITVVSTNPTTGVVAFAGSAANKGYDLAVKEINAQNFLGNTTLTLSKVDTKSTPATAAQVTTTAIADKSVATIFGSVSSNEAVAQSPLVLDAEPVDRGEAAEGLGEVADLDGGRHAASGGAPMSAMKVSSMPGSMGATSASAKPAERSQAASSRAIPAGSASRRASP